MILWKFLEVTRVTGPCAYHVLELGGVCLMTGNDLERNTGLFLVEQPTKAKGRMA